MRVLRPIWLYLPSTHRKPEDTEWSQTPKLRPRGTPTNRPGKDKDEMQRNLSANNRRVLRIRSFPRTFRFRHCLLALSSPCTQSSFCVSFCSVDISTGFLKITFDANYRHIKRWCSRKTRQYSGDERAVLRVGSERRGVMRRNHNVNPSRIFSIPRDEYLILIKCRCR